MPGLAAPQAANTMQLRDEFSQLSGSKGQTLGDALKVLEVDLDVWSELDTAFVGVFEAYL